MGLAEKEWLDMLNYEEDFIQFEDFILCANRLCQLFKENSCDIIIALTHMREVYKNCLDIFLNNLLYFL